MLEIFLLVAAIYWLNMTLYYLVATKISDVSLIDIAWGLGPAVASAVLLFNQQVEIWQQQLVLTLVIIWGLRLALHIFDRKKGSDEDWRYKKFRDQWGTNFVWKSYTNIFLIQGLLSLVVTSVIIAVTVSAGVPNQLIFWLGAALWAYGFYFEAVGDLQLKAFLAKKKRGKNKKKIMTNGLWAYTRHPNYFGELTQWWALYIVALSWGLQNWWVIIGPALLSFLIFNISGLNILEEKYAGNKEWEKYKKKTNKLIPSFSNK